MFFWLIFYLTNAEVMDFIYSVGLDSYLRFWDIKTRKLLSAVCYWTIVMNNHLNPLVHSCYVVNFLY